MISNEIKDFCYRIATDYKKMLNSEQKIMIINETRALMHYANNDKCDLYVIHHFNLTFGHNSIVLSRRVCYGVDMQVQFTEQTGLNITFTLPYDGKTGFDWQDMTDYDELDRSEIFGRITDYLCTLINDHYRYNELDNLDIE